MPCLLCHTIEFCDRDMKNQIAIATNTNIANDLAAWFNPIVGNIRSRNTTDPTDFEACIRNVSNIHPHWNRLH